MLKFIPCDLQIHDNDIIARLVYETEPSLSALLFGKPKDKALSNLNSIIATPGSSLSSDHIYLAVENDCILGLTVLYRGKDINKKQESKSISEALGGYSLFRLYFYDRLIMNRLLTNHVEKDQLYVSNVCVDTAHQGRGIGRFLLENIISYARSKHCQSIILDVSKDNERAIYLYKKMGFHIAKNRNSRLFGVSIFQMINTLD